MLIILSTVVLAAYALLGYKRPAIALITCPIVSGLLGFMAWTSEHQEAALYAPVVFIVTMAAIAVSKRDVGQGRWARAVAIWILLVTVTVLALVVLAMVFQFTHAGAVLVLLLFVLTVLLVAGSVAYAISSRHSTAAFVMSTIGSSLRQNLPLPMALQSAASVPNTRQSRTLLAIQKWLVHGYPLSAAISQGYPGCPRRALGMITAAERIDQLPQAFESIEADMLARSDQRQKVKPVHPGYPLILILVIFFVALGFATYVFPILKQVFSEMLGNELPASTSLLMGITEFLAYDYGWVLVVPMFFALYLPLMPFWRFIRFQSASTDRPHCVNRIIDTCRWYIPVLHWFEKNYSTVQLIEILRISLNAGSTVDGSIESALDLDMNNCFKQRVRRWLDMVRSGENISQSARRCRLGSPPAWAFDENANRGNTLTILKSLEEFYRSNYSYRANLIRFIAWPCVTILMALVVGFVVYAVFVPMVAVIESLTGYVTP